MDDSSDDDLQRRIERRARQLWEQEGRPKGQEAAYREKARELIAIEDNQDAATRPVPVGPEKQDAADEAEPIEAVENQGEFPTMRDQGQRRTAPDVKKRGR